MIIFDLDGVITSEDAYWDSAGLTLHEMLYSPHYWDLANGQPYRPVTTAQESRHLSRAKPGCIFFEQPLLPVEQIRAALGALRERGYILGIASGRVYQEAAKPLQLYGLLDYFDVQHIATYDVVEAAEEALRESNDFLPLGKPHAFQFMAAADRTQALAIVTGKTSGPLGVPLIAVGDSTSDILSGRGAGALTVAVLTGARTLGARERLLGSQPDFVIGDMTQLPELLARIENLSLIPKRGDPKERTHDFLVH